MLGDDDLRDLLDVFDRPWAGYRKVRKGVKKRIARRMETLGCRTAAAYLRLLDTDEDERRLCESLLLSVTISRFFRDRRLWQCLHDRLLPALADRFASGVRVWSAGCAGGEEPYSLVMAWRLLADRRHALPPLDVLATDVRPDCLQRGREGVYARNSLKELDPGLRERFFIIGRGGRRFQIRPELKAPIRWQVHNLLDPPPDGPFELILLRNNLLTYFQGARLRAAFAGVLRVLRPGGLLIVGSHEHLPPTDAVLIRDRECPWVHSLE